MHRDVDADSRARSTRTWTRTPSAVLLAGMVSIGCLSVVTSSGAASAAGTNPVWSIEASPDTSSSQINILNAVSCSGRSSCTAVGDYLTGTIEQTLIESWNGGVWSIVPSPDTSPSASNELLGVSCISPSACTAVGDEDNGPALQTLVESWNGVVWSIVPSPDSSPSAFNLLHAVSCTGPTSCMAVGAQSVAGTNQTLVEAWNGMAWSIVSSPDTSPSQFQFLNGVSCTGPSSCTAVGAFDVGPTPPDQTLVESWNGSTWSIVSSPNAPGAVDDSLSAVSCIAPTACTAVGTSVTGASTEQTLVEMWDGSSWSIASSPNPTPAQDFLRGVSCTGPSSCTAVGASSPDNTAFQTLVEIWNGTGWSVASSPNTSAVQTSLDSVSCTGPTVCTAAGADDNPGGPTINQTFVTAEIEPGYREVASDGGIFAFGGAGFYGSMGGRPLDKPVVGIAADPVTGGYWEVASDGGIFAFNAPFYGSMGAMHLDAPVVGIAADPVTGGYWEVASDGGIFAFNAPFYGSMGGRHLDKPVVGIASDPVTGGYWEVASDGGIFAFNAPFHGSMGSARLTAPVVGMARDLFTGGYWEVASDGGVFAFDAPFFGSMGGLRLTRPVVGMSTDPTTSGYWEVASDGGLFAFNAHFLGSMGGRHLDKPVVGMG